MSPSVLRSRTAHQLTATRDQYGSNHPATWAAYGRAIAAWGGARRVAPIAPAWATVDDTRSRFDLITIASIAGCRASTRPGYLNRSARRHGAARI